MQMYMATAYNGVFAVRSAHSNAFGTSQTRETLGEIMGEDRKMSGHTHILDDKQTIALSKRDNYIKSI